jgi:hypothetical protein
MVNEDKNDPGMGSARKDAQLSKIQIESSSFTEKIMKRRQLEEHKKMENFHA